MRFTVPGMLLAMAAALAGCATTAERPPIQTSAFAAPVQPTQTAPPPISPTPAPAMTVEVSVAPIQTPEVTAPPSEFSMLRGWADDDHVAALRAFMSSCGSARDPGLAGPCKRAALLGTLTEPVARGFLERNFRPEPVAEAGLLTAYFTPIYDARARRDAEFSAPVRPRPADLPKAGAGGGSSSYPDRDVIEARPAPDALAWMRPEDLFFLQIQGSGVLTFPDGSAMRAVYDGSNGAPFSGIANPMRRQGLLADEDTSAEKIRAWLAANRGWRADSIMRLDRRYVFFRLEPDDGIEPAGAAGVRLTPGRALAVDPASHAMGELLWLDAAAPALSGAFPVYRRLAMALDTGGAIKGQARVDLYMGRGPDAGLEAGRVRHQLKLYRLAPVDPPAS